MKFKKLILGCVIGFNIFGLIGCSTTGGMTEGELGSMISDIADMKMEQYKESEKYKYSDPSLLYSVECPECGGELTCTDEWCMENEEDRKAYEQHQANYREEKELQEIYNTCEICGYKQSEKENRVRRYILGEHSYRLCEESYYDCVYKKKKQLGLAETSTDIICEWCKVEKDLVHNSGHYVDIDEDGQDEYFHEICYGKWCDAHSADRYFINNNESNGYEETEEIDSTESQMILDNNIEPNMVTCDHCGRQGELYENIMRWYDTDGNNNFTHSYCLKDFIELTGKEPAYDIPGLN